MALNTDFALEGFRIIRERPQLVLYWVFLCLIKVAGGMAVISLMAGPQMMEMQRLFPEIMEKANDPAFSDKLDAVMQTVLPANLVVFLGWQLIDGILFAAIMRAVNKSVPYRFGYLTLGPEAWRMALTNLLVWVLLLVILFGLTFLVLIILSVTQGEPGLALIASFVGTLGIVFALLWAWVRLSLSWAATADKGRLAIAEGLKLTRNQAGTLFRGYALSALLGLVVTYLVQIIFTLAALGIKGGGLSQLAATHAPDTTSLETLMQPDSLIFIVVSAVSMPLSASLTIGATAAAYRQLKGLKPN
jgi:hypothetical protein